MKRVNQALKQLLRRAGYDISRYRPRTHAVAKKLDLLRRMKINLILDVGANIGQFALEMRRHGYRGRIVSFEPLSRAYATLQQRASGDPLWETKNFAIGNADGEQIIHVTSSDWSSSLLEITDTAVSAWPGASLIGSETVQVRRLDSVFSELKANDARIWLKSDTQGYERCVLEGAVQTLPKVSLLQLEMCFVPLYEGQPLFEELKKWVEIRGFRLGSIEGINWHPKTGELLYLDGVFHRPEAMPVST